MKVKLKMMKKWKEEYEERKKKNQNKKNQLPYDVAERTVHVEMTCVQSTTTS